jgi:hypothetical protein
VHCRSFLEFWTPKVPLLESESTPTGKKKKVIKNHPQKRARALPFVLARWSKKKIGVEQEKAGHVMLENA